VQLPVCVSLSCRRTIAAFTIQKRGRCHGQNGGILALQLWDACKRVSAAKQFWLETRNQLNEHTAKHGC
jgi:hypothetical protein